MDDLFCFVLFGTTVLGSAFEAAAEPKSFEFGTAVARRLEQA